MLSPLVIVTLVVALLSVTGAGVVLNSVRFLLNNPPLFAFILLVLCVLTPCNDGHACEQLDESGRLLPCYPLPHSKYVGQMCRAAERRRVLRRLWREVQYVLDKFSNPVSTGIQGIWPWVSYLSKSLRDGAPIFLSSAQLILRTAYTSTEVRRVALAVCFAGLVDYLVRYALVPEVAVLLVSVGAGWTFRAPLWEYLKSTGPVLSYIDCYNQELAAQSERDARKGCLSLVKHRKHESTPTPRSQATSTTKDCTTGPEKLRVSPAPKSDPSSTSKPREDERRAPVSSPAPVRSTIDKKLKNSKRTPKAKVAAPTAATGTRESKRKVINSPSKGEPVEKSATPIMVPHSELSHEMTASRAPVLSEPTSGAAVAEKECGVAPTSKIVDVPPIESAISSQEPGVSTNPASPIIFNDRCSEAGASQVKDVYRQVDEEKSERCLVPSFVPEIKASKSKAFDEKTVGDSKPVKENIEHEGKSVFTEATIAPVSQANSFGASNAPVPTLPPTPPVSEDSSQAESTPSTTCNVGSAEQQAHVSDEPQLQSRSLSTDSATVKETRVPTSLEDAPTASGTPAASCRSTNAPTNSNQSEAPVTTTLSGQSLKLTTPKRQKILKSPSRSTSSRVLRLYASNPRFQIKDAVRAAQLKKKKCASKKAKLSRRSKRPATAAVPPVVSTEPSVAAPVQPPPAAVSETPAPLSEGLGLAGTTAMEVCQQTAETPIEPAAIGSAANASLDSIDAPMSPAEPDPIVSLPVMESPLPATQPIPLAPIPANPQMVAPPAQVAAPPVIPPRVPRSIPCKPVDAASFFKPYKPVQVPRLGSSAAFVGPSGATTGNGTPQPVSATPWAMPTTGGLSDFAQHTPAQIPRPAASSSFAGPPPVNIGQIPIPKLVSIKPVQTLKTGSTVVYNPAEEELIAAFKKSSRPSKPSKVTETDLDYKLVVAPSAPGACRQLGRVEAQKNMAPRKNVVYSLDAQGKNRVAAGEVGKDTYVYKWNLDLGTPGVKMRAPAELWKA